MIVNAVKSKVLGYYYRTDGFDQKSKVAELTGAVAPSTTELSRRLSSHLNWCAKNVPFYEGIRVNEENAHEVLARLPIFPKNEAKISPSHFCPRTLEPGTAWDTTSGTSGKTFTFPISMRERAVRRAYELAANSILGLESGTSHLVIWGGHESDRWTKKLRAKVFDAITDRELVVISGVNKRNLDMLHSSLRNYHAGVLITYPSILAALCAFGLAEALMQLDKIILTGEAVDSGLLRQYELKNVVNRYGTREFGAIACGTVDCLYFFSDRFILEHDSETGLLITDLERRSMPLIRYPIGDFAPQLSDFKSCTWRGLRGMGPLAGRVIDCVRGRSGKVYAGTYWTLTMRTIGVSQFRIRQKNPGAIDVIFVGAMESARVVDLLRGYLQDDLEIIATRVDDIPSLENSKQRIVEVM